MKRKKISRLVKIFSLLICFLSLGTGCAVSATAGKVTIVNRSDKAVKNVKVGDRVLALYIFPGAEVEYWYITGIRGTFSVEEVDYAFANNGWENVEEPEISLSLGYHYQITIFQNSSTAYEYQAEITRTYQGDQAKDSTTESDWISD